MRVTESSRQTLHVVEKTLAFHIVFMDCVCMSSAHLGFEVKLSVFPLLSGL